MTPPVDSTHFWISPFWSNIRRIAFLYIIPINSNFNMKKYGFELRTPPTGSRTGQKNFFLGSCPEVISYRLSHKWARSVKPLKGSSEDGWTDGRTDKARTIPYSRKYARKKSELSVIKLTEKKSKFPTVLKLHQFLLLDLKTTETFKENLKIRATLIFMDDPLG